jgi:hypothetical protein
VQTAGHPRLCTNPKKKPADLSPGGLSDRVT